MDGFESEISTDDQFTIESARHGVSERFTRILHDRVLLSDGLGSFRITIEEDTLLVLDDFLAVPEQGASELRSLLLLVGV